MAFDILRGKIARAAADAVACLTGSLAERELLAAAGEELLGEREKQGTPAPGKAAAVKAGLPQAKYAVFSSLPEAGKVSEDERRQAYISALELAADIGCKTVALSLSGGESGREEDVTAAVSACTVFLGEHDLSVSLIVDEDAPSPAGGRFDEVKKYLADSLAGRDGEARAPARSSPGAKKPREAGRAAFFVRRKREAEPLRAELGRETLENAPVFSMMTADSLDDFLKQEEPGFSEYLLELLKEKNVKDSEIYRRAQVSRQLFNRIINNRDYRPAKSTAIQLALALELDTAQTQKLLEKAGYSLTRSSRADLVIQYYISKGIFGIPEINMALFDCGLPLLSTGTGS